ncbi:MAG: UrcA family protein [Pseudomonadota bacterium]
MTVSTCFRSALACGALTLTSYGVHAGSADQAGVVISSPVVKIIGKNADLVPIEEISVTARVSFDPASLTTNSAVTRLQDRVRETARRVCSAADPDDVEDDETCIRKAIKAPLEEIKVAVAVARKGGAGS